MNADARLVAGQARRRLSAPQRLAVAMVVLTVFLGAAATVSLLVASSFRTAVQTIGLEAQPSVLAALRIRRLLTDMDADALTDAVADGAVAAGTSEVFHARAAELDNFLLRAALRAPALAGADGPIAEMQRYLRLYSEALGETRWAGRDNAWLAVQRVRWASRLLNGFLRPAAEAYQVASTDALNRASASFDAGAGTREAALVIVGVALLAGLAAVQVDLARRSRRLINLPLGAATLVCVAACALLGTFFYLAHVNLEEARHDVQAKRYPLNVARLTAHEIRADRASWLFDFNNRRATDASTAAAVTALVGTPASDTSDAPAAPEVGGVMGELLAQYSAAGEERELLERAATALTAYLRSDRAMRVLELGRRHVEAVAFGLGDEPGAAGALFREVDQALAKAQALADQQFGDRVQRALRMTGYMSVVGAGGFGLALLLAAAGLWQRYRVFL